MIFLKILTRGIDHTFSHSEQKKFGEQNYKGCKKNYSAHILNYSAHIFSHVPSNFTLFYPKKSDKNEGDTPAVGVSPFLYTNIQHISAKSKCPPSGLEISLFSIFSYLASASTKGHNAPRPLRLCVRVFPCRYM